MRAQTSGGVRLRAATLRPNAPVHPIGDVNQLTKRTSCARTTAPDPDKAETTAERAVGGRLYEKIFGPPLLISNHQARGAEERSVMINPAARTTVRREREAYAKRGRAPCEDLPSERVPAYKDPGASPNEAYADLHGYRDGHMKRCRLRLNDHLGQPTSTHDHLSDERQHWGTV